MSKSALVTGASRGIGEKICLSLAASGYEVFLAARSFGRLQELVEEINETGGQAEAVKLDLQEKDSIVKCAEKVEEAVAGELDVLINNAGYGIYGRVDQVPLEAARHLFEVNYFGALELTLELLSALESGSGGRVINVASSVAKRGFPVMSHYAASKAALESISESMREELKPRGIEVQVVYPLRTESKFSESARRYVPGKFSFPGHGPTQSAEEVAETIARALENNKFRIHPHYSTRLLGVLNELIPGLVARILKFKETVLRSFGQTGS